MIIMAKATLNEFSTLIEFFFQYSMGLDDIAHIY